MDHDAIPTSVIQDDEQHTMHYAQSLPYVRLLDGEADQWLGDICNNLALCVKAQDYSVGTLAWVKRLGLYLDMKHALPRALRAHLAKLLYALTITPGMDTVLVETWANTCVRLIRWVHSIICPAWPTS
ncbi:uncharacterized protein BYT42DRAFT_312627 [Radiomyces spectabilis]|uniref:uncharacterized protein n=1 Tax=Radiomyces spectabilis TaxID=64574 RepID=UPI002220960E|nr:uncharacterized protein BYT42DRAFT_312627 [Radiomyces spectabilis]KAI8379086.1 hypothetical protein BYT42DRAFT_312627 [Radiomyces spectabilis]